MKKVFFFIFFSMGLFQGAASAQNPYQSIGKPIPKGKMLTLSDGKFQEFFPNDTLVPIGSIMYNTVTEQVVALLTRDTMYSEYNLEPEIVSRWLSPDPLATKFPSMSPYNYAGNSPIMNIDVKGLFQFPAHLAKLYAEKYPLFTKYLQENIQKDVQNSATLINGLVKYSNGGLSKENIKEDLTFGKGPTIVIADLDVPNLAVDGHYEKENGVHTLFINEKIIAAFEKAAGNPKVGHLPKQALLLGAVSTVLHEYVHYGDRDNDYGGDAVEEGHAFEAEVYSAGISIRPIDETINILPTISVINLLTTGKYNPANKKEDKQTDKMNPSVLPTVPIPNK
jgi:hypothetical protein